MNYRSVKGIVTNLVDNLESERDELAAKIEAVRAAAIEITRFPLALFAVCKLCGERTDSSSVHRMDPEPRHKQSCALNQSGNSDAT